MHQEDLRKLSQQSVRILKEQVFRLKESGTLLNDISDITGVSKATVLKWIEAKTDNSLDSNLIKELLNNLQNTWPESQALLQRQISNLHKKHLNITEISELTGLDKSWIISNLPNTEEEYSQEYFYQINLTKDIKLDQNTQILKSKDVCHYYNSMTLLEHVKALSKSKKEAHKKALEEAKQIGYKEGKQNANIYLSQRNIEFADSMNIYLTKVENRLSNIVHTLVHKIIEDYNDADYVTHNINSALKNLRDNQKFTLHVHSDLLQEVSNHFKTSENIINIVPDSSLDKKDCILITEIGITNLCLKNQLDIIAQC